MKNEDTFHVYKEPLPRSMRVGILVAVIFFHVGGGWALTQIEPARLVVGDVAPMEVSFVAPPQPPSPPQPEPTPPQPTPPQVEPTPPEPVAEVESMIEPPMPDLPPPVFPVDAPPPRPKPPPPPPRPRQVTNPPPSEAPPQPAAAAAPAPQAGPKTVTDAQVGYLTRPSPIYPMRAKRAGNQGTAMVRVLVDASGRPSQVVLQTSSGFPDLDESALSALRAARFRPFVDAGMASAVWVICPIGFALQ